MNNFRINTLPRFVGAISLIGLVFAVVWFWLYGYATFWAAQTGFVGEFWWGVMSVLLVILAVFAVVLMFHPRVPNWLGSVVALVAAIVVASGYVWLTTTPEPNWGFFGLGAASGAAIIGLAATFVGYGFIFSVLRRQLEGGEGH